MWDKVKTCWMSLHIILAISNSFIRRRITSWFFTSSDCSNSHSYQKKKEKPNIETLRPVLAPPRSWWNSSFMLVRQRSLWLRCWLKYLLCLPHVCLLSAAFITPLGIEFTREEGSNERALFWSEWAVFEGTTEWTNMMGRRKISSSIRRPSIAYILPWLPEMKHALGKM